MAGLEELRNLSGTKIRLLKILKEWKDLTDISNECGLKKQSLIPHLRFLNTFGLIEKKGRYYRTTKVGELFLEKFSEFARFLNVIGSCGKFLSEYDISPIPANLLSRVGSFMEQRFTPRKTLTSSFQSGSISSKIQVEFKASLQSITLPFPICFWNSQQRGM
jgi:predicted transcriptional regulator